MQSLPARWMRFVPQAFAVGARIPQRGFASSPGLVAIGDLPWVEAETKDIYPNGVAPAAAPSGRNPVGVEIAFDHRTQGSTPTACNPGLEAKPRWGMRTSNTTADRSQAAGTKAR